MNALLGLEATAGLDASALSLNFAVIPAGNYEIGARGLENNPLRIFGLDAFDLAKTPTTNAQLATGLQLLEERNSVLMTPLAQNRWAVLARGTMEEVRGISLDRLREIIDELVGQSRVERVGDLFVAGGLEAFDSATGSVGSARIIPVTLEAHLLQGFDRPKQPALTTPLEATAVAALFGLELPTGVQWEAAAGDLRDEKYRGVEELRRVAHFQPATATADVGTREPNKFGLHDILGNVWQAMSNRYEKGKEAREFRGGSWADGHGLMRAAFRFYVDPDIWYNYRGFRLFRPHTSVG